MDVESSKIMIDEIPQEIPQNPLKEGESMVKRDERGRILPGSILNPNGYVKGQKNYATVRKEALEEIAKVNPGKTPDEIEVMLVSKGIAEALKGNYQFYKDDLDRTHGKAVQPVGNADGKPFIINITKEIADQNDITTNPIASDNSKG